MRFRLFGTVLSRAIVLRVGNGANLGPLGYGAWDEHEAQRYESKTSYISAYVPGNPGVGHWRRAILRLWQFAAAVLLLLARFLQECCSRVEWNVLPQQSTATAARR